MYSTQLVVRLRKKQVDGFISFKFHGERRRVESAPADPSHCTRPFIATLCRLALLIPVRLSSLARGVQCASQVADALWSLG